FSNMKLKWEGEAIPLSPPMLAIAAAGDAGQATPRRRTGKCAVGPAVTG
ncbi:hypothetical protein Tco_0665790, partial [Tanacetum coccineum]